MMETIYRFRHFGQKNRLFIFEAVASYIIRWELSTAYEHEICSTYHGVKVHDLTASPSKFCGYQFQELRTLCTTRNNLSRGSAKHLFHARQNGHIKVFFSIRDASNGEPDAFFRHERLGKSTNARSAGRTKSHFSSLTKTNAVEKRWITLTKEKSRLLWSRDS